MCLIVYIAIVVCACSAVYCMDMKLSNDAAIEVCRPSVTLASTEMANVMNQQPPHSYSYIVITIIILYICVCMYIHTHNMYIIL